MSTARSITLYIEPKTLKRLRLALRLYPQYISSGGGVTSDSRQKTTDELADELLNQMIKASFPLVLQLEKTLTQAERDFLTEHKQQQEHKQYNEKETTNT